MSRICTLNEDFFIQDSEEVFYILGLIVKSCIFSKDSRKKVMFRDRNYDLIKMIHTHLGANYEIILDNRGKRSYFFEVSSERLHLSLEERGLTPDKKDRRFLENIPEEFICDNIRGFIENECGSERIEVITKIQLRFNHNYLVELNEKLRYYAGVQKIGVTEDFTQYGIQDTKRIYDFIYQDTINGLYLPEIKDKFEFKTPYYKNKELIDEKIKIAKKNLLKGVSCAEISELLGYKNRVSFYIFFRKNTGIKIRDFIREARV